jgi:hypothetical protein
MAHRFRSGQPSAQIPLGLTMPGRWDTCAGPDPRAPVTL